MWAGLFHRSGLHLAAWAADHAAQQLLQTTAAAGAVDSADTLLDAKRHEARSRNLSSNGCMEIVGPNSPRFLHVWPNTLQVQSRLERTRVLLDERHDAVRLTKVVTTRVYLPNLPGCSLSSLPLPQPAVWETLLTTPQPRRRELSELEPVLSAWAYTPPGTATSVWDDDDDSDNDDQKAVVMGRQTSRSRAGSTARRPAVAPSAATTGAAVPTRPRSPDLVQRTLASLMFWRKPDGADAATAKSTAAPRSAGRATAASAAVNNKVEPWTRVRTGLTTDGWVDVHAEFAPYASDRLAGPAGRVASSAVSSPQESPPASPTAGGGRPRTVSRVVPSDDADRDSVLIMEPKPENWASDSESSAPEDPDEVLAALPLSKQMLRYVPDLWNGRVEQCRKLSALVRGRAGQGGPVATARERPRLCVC